MLDHHLTGSDFRAQFVRVPTALRHHPVLNADFQPLSCFPLSQWSWRDVIKAVFSDCVTIRAEYDNIFRRRRRVMPFASVAVPQRQWQA